MTIRISEAFDAVVNLVTVLKAAPLNRCPGAWEHQLGDTGWYIAVNAHGEPRRVTPEGGMPVDVPPFHLAVWWHGWLAGILHPTEGGQFAAHPDGANEDRFIADVTAATKAASA